MARVFPAVSGEFWVPRRERQALQDLDRRDLLEMTAGMAAYFDRVERENPGLESPSGLDALRLMAAEQMQARCVEPLEVTSEGLLEGSEQPGRVFDPFLGMYLDEIPDQATRVMVELFSEVNTILEELDPGGIYDQLSDLEAGAAGFGSDGQQIRLLAKAAREQLVSSKERNFPRAELLQLRELVRQLEAARSRRYRGTECRLPAGGDDAA